VLSLSLSANLFALACVQVPVSQGALTVDERSDSELIAAAVAGSERAWSQLVRRHETQVYNLGLRLTGSAADACDLMQETFVAVYRNLHRFRADARFSSWLYRIVHNKSVDLFRRRRLPDAHAIFKTDGEAWTPPLVDDDTPGPQQVLLSEEQNRHIMQLMATLPLAQRLLVEMKVYQGLTFEEIADIQQISPNTAKTRFYSALKKLRAKMEASHVLS